MSLAEDLDEFFADSDEVIVQEPLKFKAQLGIGEKAYGLLRAREKMGTFSQAIGIGAGASTIAGSSVVASTFFASSGFMASALSTIGLEQQQLHQWDGLLRPAFYLAVPMSG